MSDVGKLDRPDLRPQDLPAKTEDPSYVPPSSRPEDAIGTGRMNAVRAERDQAAGELAFRASNGRTGTPPLARLQQHRSSVAADLQRRIGVQRKARGPAGSGAKIPDQAGAPLPSTVREKMEPAIGADLSSARVHTGGESAQAARDLNARAFTVGKDVHFGSGQFAPGTREGDRLLAHELAHVVQGERSVVQRKEKAEKPEHPAAEESLEVSDPGDAAEKEADAVADGATNKLHEPGAAAGAGDVGAKAPPAEKPAPISAKLEGVGRKVYRAPLTDVPVAKPHHVGPGPAPSTVAGANLSGPSMAENPDFEKDAAAFEVNLGGVAFSIATATGAAMVAKARAYIEAKVPVGDFKNLGTETKALLEKCGGAKAAFAGAVGTDAAVIQQLTLTSKELDELTTAAGADAAKLKAIPQPANVREQMTFVYNFASNILTADLLNTKKDQLDGWIAKAKLDAVKIDERVKFIEQQAQLRKANGQARPGTDGKVGWDAVGMVPQPAGGGIVGGSGGADAKTARPVADQWSARSNRKDTEQKAGAAPSGDISTRTAGQVASTGAGLSKREEKFMGIGAPTDALKWSEGAKMWIINERDKWVKAMRALSLPLAAGPSGTTGVLMNAAAMLGGAAPVDVRMACVGYLLPIKAHSLVEILGAAAAFGVPFTADKQMYRNLPPLAEPQLRSCGRPGPDGKKLFPDEAPAPAAPVASAAAGPASKPVPPKKG